MLIASSWMLQLDWSLGTGGFLLLTLVSGVFVEGSVYVALAALSIRVLEVRSALLVVNSIFDAFGGYPTHAFSKGAQILLTFVLPVAFIAYFPATIILGETGSLKMPLPLAYCTPLVGVLLFGGAVHIWQKALHHYQGAGH